MSSLKGPPLVEVVQRLLVEKGYTGKRCAEEFGVGVTWLSDLQRGAKKEPSVGKLQLIYETLTGKPLIEEEAPTGEGAGRQAGASGGASTLEYREAQNSGQAQKGAH